MSPFPRLHIASSWNPDMSTDDQLKEQLNILTDRIIDSYVETGTARHLGHCPLPSTGVVVEILDDLQEVLFPGYRRRQNLHLGNITYYIGDLIDGLHGKLTQQISRALRYEYDQKHGLTGTTQACQRDFEAEGQQAAVEFLGTLPEIRRILLTDVQAAYDGDPAASGRDEIIFCYPGMLAVTIHRIAHQLYRQKIPLIPRMMSEYSHSRTGIDIHPGATIGPSFFIDHGTGVVIGETCEIGTGVKIYQGVTLGALSFAKDGEGNLVRGTKRHPTLQNNVVIYANATILGGHTVIGENSVVGANVWLTKSVPANTTVTIETPTLRLREAS